MKFDEYQQKAVEATSRQALVVSAAGSGKTRTIVGRLNYMIQTLKISPSRIVAITFTRAAAQEIRDRVGSAKQLAFIGTLHAFGLRMIMQQGKPLGYDREWMSICFDDEVYEDEMEVLTDLGIVIKRPDKYAFKMVGKREWDAFKEYKICGTPIDLKPKQVKVLEKAWNLLLQRLRIQNVLTFGTILYESIELLADRAALLYFRKRYHHFLLDEAQDTDHQQWRLIWRILGKYKPKTLFVVGDIDQSIYNWRGAEPQLVLKYSRLPSTDVYNLPYSYRFGPQIANAANSLIQHNHMRLETEIIPKGPDGKITFHREQTWEDTAKLLREEIDRQKTPENIAVLARSHSILEELLKACERFSLPVVKIGTLGEIQNSPFWRSTMAYLRLMVNPWDKRAYMGVTAVEGISAAKIQESVKRASTEGLPYAKATGLSLPDSLEALQEHLASKPHFLERLEVIDWIKTTMYMEGIPSIDEFIQYAMTSKDDVIASVQNSVILCTIHAAKGLEWPCIFLIGMNRNRFPMPSTRPSRFEEERRLCYVAITRAQKRLYLVHNQMEFHRHADVSQFVEEMGVK